MYNFPYTYLMMPIAVPYPAFVFHINIKSPGHNGIYKIQDCQKFRCAIIWEGPDRRFMAKEPGQVNDAMKSLLKKLWKHFLQQVKFAASGLVATTTDYVLYLVLVHSFFAPVPSNVISYSIAMVINFLLQRKFVFSLQGSAFRTFLMSAMVSIGGLLLSTAIIYGLTQIQFYFERQYLTKLIATAMVFFYNFYLKRIVFERCFSFKCDIDQMSHQTSEGAIQPESSGLN